MNRYQRMALLLRLMELLREKGSWCGAMHIQKSAYFAQDLTKVPFGYDYVIYKYGPFSSSLRDELSGMLALLVAELEVHDMFYSPKYRIGKRGGNVIERFGECIIKYENQLKFVSDKIGHMKIKELEQVGTALFVTREMGNEASVGLRCDRLLRRKPHIAKRDAETAIEGIDSWIEEAHVFDPELITDSANNLVSGRKFVNA